MEVGRIPNNRLKKYRRIAGLSQKQVARMLGLSDTSPLSRWENGLVYPNISYLFKLCRIYKTIPQELFTDQWQKITIDYTRYEQNLLNQSEIIY